MALAERLSGIFEKTFNLSRERFSTEIVPEDVPNWDSIGHMNLVSAMEGEFGIQFEVDDIMEMSSVAKILEILQAKGVKD